MGKSGIVQAPHIVVGRLKPIQTIKQIMEAANQKRPALVCYHKRNLFCPLSPIVRSTVCKLKGWKSDVL